jgi:hypothetical protein
MESEPDIVAEEPEVESPSVESEPEVHTDNSGEEDAVLDRLLGIDAPAPRQAAPTPEATAPADDPEMDRALKALRRDGVPDHVIESSMSDPAKLREWGLKAAKRQADVDAFGAKVAEERKKAETPKASTETGDGEADADPLSQFSEMFGEDASKPIKSLADKLRSEFAERTRDMEVKYEMRSAYRDIASEYGKDAPSYDEITEVAARVGRENPGKFDSIADVVREAFRQRAGAPRKTDPRNLARPNVGRTPPRPVKEVDREDVILDVLLSGGTRADALRAATR